MLLLDKYITKDENPKKTCCYIQMFKLFQYKKSYLFNVQGSSTKIDQFSGQRYGLTIKKL